MMQSTTSTPGVPDWAGIAAIKRAGALYAERGYSTRLLAAAYRHHGHWSELIGGDVILVDVPQNAYSQLGVRVSADEVAPGDPAIAPLEAESAWAFTDDEFGLAWDAGGSSSCNPASAPQVACGDDFDGLRLCLPNLEVVDCLFDGL